MIVSDHKIVASKQKLSTSPRLSAECPTKTLSPKSGSDKNPPPSLVTLSLGGAHQGLDLPGDASPATTSESISVFPANALDLPHTMTSAMLAALPTSGSVAPSLTNAQRSPLRQASFDDVSDQEGRGTPPPPSVNATTKKRKATKEKEVTKKPKTVPTPTGEQFQLLQQQMAFILTQLAKNQALPWQERPRR